MKLSEFGITAAFVGLFLVASGVKAGGDQDKSDLTREERSAWYQRLKWPADCEESFQSQAEDIPDAGLTFHRLKDKQYLVEIQCYLGAYQPGFVFMFYDEARTKTALLKFKRYERETDGRVSRYLETELSGFPEFDDKTKELKVWSKSRGIGDCGSIVVYTFRNGQPVVKEARAQACQDDPDAPFAEPEAWPRVRNP